MKISFKIGIAVLILVPMLAKAQPQNTIANFMYNQLLYNPASAGMQEAQFNAALLGRLQWSTIEGAPTVAHLWTDYRLKSNKMALGLNLSNVSYSGYSNNDINANYAYNINLTRKLKLALGLRAGVYFSKFGLEDFAYWDEQDEVINSSTYNYTLFKAGTGFQLNSKKSYLGLSVPDLFVPNKPEVTGDTAKGFFKQKRNFVLMGGTKIALGDLYNLKPNVALFYHGLVGFRGNVNATFEIKDYFWAGLTYSTVRSFTLLAGTNISSRIRFGYAFEFYAGKTGARSLNTHEVNLTMQLDNLIRRIK
jgi:type IX secretion system PorP/SprF family membrane protein